MMAGDVLSLRGRVFQLLHIWIFGFAGLYKVDLVCLLIVERKAMVQY